MHPSPDTFVYAFPTNIPNWQVYAACIPLYRMHVVDSIFNCMQVPGNINAYKYNRISNRFCWDIAWAGKNVLLPGAS